jgi:hypothetical protein
MEGAHSEPKEGNRRENQDLLIKHTAHVWSKLSMTTIHKESPQCISELVVIAFKSQIMPITLLCHLMTYFDDKRFLGFPPT